MLSAVLHTIGRHALFTRGDRVLVAVSGGPDSMALLAVLWELAPRLGLALEVATVNHGLRRDAAGEQDLVVERAQALGLPCHRLDIAVRPGGVRGGIQQAARDARLTALAALAREQECARVALGHQADDQAETILFRIIRGTGPKGLAGIPHRREPFVRPLLDVTRARILAYLRRRSLPYVTDPSNADLRYARARIRHTILPLLRKENPRIHEALCRLAAPDEADLAAQDVTGALQGTAGIHLPGRLAAQVRSAADQGGTRTFDLAGGRRLTVSYGRVVLEPRPPGADPVAEPPAEVLIPGPGHYALGPGTGIVVRAGQAVPSGDGGPTGGPSASGLACFDAEFLSWPLVLRRRRPGDRMQLRGGRGSRKLSDLLIDAKIARDSRAMLPVVTDADGEVLFVPGVRPSRIAAPSPTTRQWIALEATAGVAFPVVPVQDRGQGCGDD